MSKQKEEKVEAPVASLPFDFDTFEIKSIEDVYTWNIYCRKAFREAKKQNPKCDPPFHVKVPEASFHKHLKVKFQRFDQPENLLKVRRRTKEIDWEGQLKPGCVYDLPVPIINYLNSLSVPIFAEVKVENGGETKTETKQIGERNRFSCHLMEIM